MTEFLYKKQIFLTGLDVLLSERGNKCFNNSSMTSRVNFYSDKIQQLSPKNCKEINV